jgi:hypothetical protein
MFTYQTISDLYQTGYFDLNDAAAIWIEDNLIKLLQLDNPYLTDQLLQVFQKNVSEENFCHLFFNLSATDKSFSWKDNESYQNLAASWRATSQKALTEWATEYQPLFRKLDKQFPNLQLKKHLRSMAEREPSAAQQIFAAISKQNLLMCAA